MIKLHNLEINEENLESYFDRYLESIYDNSKNFFKSEVTLYVNVKKEVHEEKTFIEKVESKEVFQVTRIENFFIQIIVSNLRNDRELIHLNFNVHGTLRNKRNIIKDILRNLRKSFKK